MQGLPGNGEGAGNHRLRGDDGGQGGQRHQRVQQPFGCQQVEGVLDGRGVVHDERALAEIVEHQRRQHEAEPGEADRDAAEMAHVGIESLAPRHRQHDSAQRHECQPVVAREKVQGVDGVDCQQHVGAVQDVDDAERGQRAEPHQHHGSEQLTDRGGSLALHPEQGEQHSQCNGDDQAVKRRGGDFQAFDCRQHGNGGGDHAVGEEHAGPDDAEHHDETLLALVFSGLVAGQRDQRHDAAFAAVVGAHHESDILDRDHHDERPQDER